MTTAPTKRTRLRSAIEALAPTADLICVVSAVSRETISPERAGVEEGRRRAAADARRRRGAQVGDDPLAERHHEVVAGRARKREHAASAISARKVRLTKAASLDEKPTSIMRRIASGIASVASAATTSAPTRRERPGPCSARRRGAATASGRARLAGLSPARRSQSAELQVGHRACEEEPSSRPRRKAAAAPALMPQRASMIQQRAEDKAAGRFVARRLQFTGAARAIAAPTTSRRTEHP